MARGTKPSELAAYIEAGYDLIPLHKHDAIDQKGRQRGKSPRDSRWRTNVYNTDETVKLFTEKGFNIGVRLNDTDLVLDVDPRNFREGDDPLARLCADIGLELADYPHVVTGSGGSHYYMKKPPSISVRDTLDAYEGLEFKVLGRQVVSAGSLHPDSSKPYEWDFLSPPFSAKVKAPDVFINLIKKPPAPAATGGGEHTAEEVESMLEKLDSTTFSDHSQWLTVMMACHHASAGEARQEFIDWSTSDPKYRDDAWIIGRRWDSLHADASAGRVTFRTLHKYLRDVGADDAIPKVLASDDFEDIDPDEEVRRSNNDLDEIERRGPLEWMNEKYWAVDEGGKFRIYYEGTDPGYNPSRKYWIRSAYRDFELMLSNRKVERGETVVPVAKAWLEWASRRTVDGVIFDPARVHPNYLNLWTGWSVEPKKGDWSLMQDLLFEVLCDGDQESYDYVLNWSANAIQKPDIPAGVAVCFQGEKGVGKGTYCRALTSLAGRHGLHITSPEHLTGRFNLHLRDCVFLFADEALSPFDKAGTMRLQGLITEPTIFIEGKSMNADSQRNMVHVLMASNEDWFVPMGLDGERRYFISKVNNKRQGDKAFFDRLNKQMDNGGLAAMLWDLQARDVKDFSASSQIPVTPAAIEQKVRGMGPMAGWWMNILLDGTLPGDGDGDWYISRVRVFRTDLRTSFDAYCRANGIRPGASNRSSDMMFAESLRKLCDSSLDTHVKMKVPADRPDISPHNDGRHWAYDFPCMDDCRNEMERKLGGNPGW